MSDAPQVREQDPALGGTPVDQGARVVVVEAPAVLTTEDVVEDLKRQLAEKATKAEETDAALAREKEQREVDRRGRENAEARARDSEAQARQAAQGGQRAIDEANFTAVKNALDSSNSQMANLKVALASATSEGDFVKAADIQADMSKVGAKIVQLEDGQSQLEARIKNPPADQGRAPQTDPARRREEWIMEQPPRVQDWLRGPNGSRYFSDPEFRDRVASAANHALKGRRIDPGSQEYIDYIETEVGLRQAAAAPPPPPNPAPAPAGRDAGGDDRRMVTAPAGGSTAGSVRAQPDGSTQVYLTQDERDMARRMGLTEAEWAREKAGALRDGQIGPNARNR